MLIWSCVCVRVSSYNSRYYCDYYIVLLFDVQNTVPKLCLYAREPQVRVCSRSRRIAEKRYAMQFITFARILADAKCHTVHNSCVFSLALISLSFPLVLSLLVSQCVDCVYAVVDSRDRLHSTTEFVSLFYFRRCVDHPCSLAAISVQLIKKENRLKNYFQL